LFLFRLLFDLCVSGDDIGSDDEDGNGDDDDGVCGSDICVSSIGMGPVSSSFSGNV
jgi:hypothetical protein